LRTRNRYEIASILAMCLGYRYLCCLTNHLQLRLDPCKTRLEFKNPRDAGQTNSGVC
jgi:hypothetical protein